MKEVTNHVTNVLIRTVLMERDEIYVYISKKNKQLLAGSLSASCTSNRMFLMLIEMNDGLIIE